MNTPRPNDPAPIVTPVEDTALVRARARGRTRLVGTLLGLALLAISAQGAVNVVDPDPRTLSVLAEKRWRAVPVEGQRGTVYTADGTELATSVRHPSIYVDPVAVREQAGEKNGLPVAEVARRIAGVLGRPESEIRDILDRPGRFERVAVDVHPEVADRMRSDADACYANTPAGAGAYLARAGLRPEIAGSNVYRAGALVGSGIPPRQKVMNEIVARVYDGFHLNLVLLDEVTVGRDREAKRNPGFVGCVGFSGITGVGENILCKLPGQLAQGLFLRSHCAARVDGL